MDDDSWARLRGALKDVFATFGGGEAYLRAERSGFEESVGLRDLNQRPWKAHP